MQDKKSVLIVDDMLISREALKAVLENDYNCYELDNGTDVPDFLYKHRDVSLVLLDLVMPDKSGIEVLKNLKADKELCRVPVIVCTADDDEATEEEVLELGAEDYLLKPIKPVVVRKRVQNTLARDYQLTDANNKVQAVFDNLPGAIAIFEVEEKNLKMTFISEGCQRVTGFSADETIHRLEKDSLFDVHPEDRQMFSLMELSQLDEENVASYIHRVRCKNGQYRWVKLTFSKSYIQGKACYCGVYVDVNQEHETTLMQNQLLDALPGGVAIYKVGKSIESMFFSEGVPALTGRTREEYLSWIDGKNHKNTIYEDDLPMLREKIALALSKGEPLQATYRMKHKDGSLVWVQIHATKLRDEDDSQIYYAVYSKPEEEAALYQSIVEDSETAIFVIEYDKRKVLYANPALIRLTGLENLKDIQGHRLSELVHGKNALLTDEEVEELEENSYQEFRKMGNSGKHLHILAKRIRWNGIGSYIGYVTDETEIQMNRLRLQKLIDRIPGGIGIYQIHKGIPYLEYINEAYFEMLGDKREDRTKYLGEAVILAAHKEDRKKIYQSFQDVQEGKDDIDITYRVDRGDGTHIWIRMVGVVVDRTNETIVLYACFSDFEDFMRKQLELLYNRQMLDVALETAQTMVWRYNPNTHTITDSGSLGTMYHLPKVVGDIPESLIKADYLHPDSVGRFRALFERMPSEEPQSADVEVRSAEGDKYIWKRIVYTPVMDEHGILMDEIGSSIDITEQKQSELRYEYELQMRSELLNDTIIYYQVNVTRWEIEERKFLSPDVKKYNPPRGFDDNVWHQAVDDYFDEEYRRECREKFQMNRLRHAFEHGITQVKIPYFRLQPQVYDRWCSAQAALMRRPGSEDVIAMIYVRDIDSRHKKQLVSDSIVEEETEMIALLDVRTGSAQAIKTSANCYHKPETEWYHFDTYVQKIQKNTIGENTLLFGKHPYSYEGMIDWLNQGGNPLYSYNVIGEDGMEHRKMTRAFYLDNRKQDVVIVRRDVTETYRDEQVRARALQKALDKTKEANKAKSAFLSRVSHDMRTPLNGILGLTGLMKDKSDIQEIKRDLNQLTMSGEYLLNLVNDTLDVAKIESNQMELHPEVCNGKDIFSNAFSLVSQNIKMKNIHFSVNDEKMIYKVLYVDVGRLEQLMVNIIGNAVKFTPEGGRIDVTLETKSENESQIVTLVKVRDTGIGMTKEYIPKLFDPFSQEDDNRTSKYQGTGLGMSISKQIVELMGGSIHVESEKDKGTEISFDLHMRKATEEQKISRIKPAAKISDLSKLEGKRILLCEDHPLNTKIAVAVLEKKNMLVDTASDGKMGVRMFSQSPEGYYAAILMDIRMPVMDGLDATRLIRGMNRQDAETIPIMAMTANALSDDVDQSKNAGMNEHLSKPIEPTILYSKLAKWIQNS